MNLFAVAKSNTFIHYFKLLSTIFDVSTTQGLTRWKYAFEDESLTSPSPKDKEPFRRSFSSLLANTVLLWFRHGNPITTFLFYKI
jgi:hypothetical protein